MLDPSLTTTMPVHLSEVPSMKRRRSDETDDRAKRTNYQRDSDSDGGVPKHHHHHHHHHHKKAVVKLDDESPESVTGVCTLKEGSLKLKISLHRPPSSMPTTPDGDSLVPASLSHSEDNKDGKPVDNAMNDRPKSAKQTECNGIVMRRDENVLPPVAINAPLVLCTNDCFEKAGENPGIDETTQLSGRTTARKSKMPGHFVLPEPKMPRRTLLSDMSKLRKPRTNQASQPVAQQANPKFRGTILDSGLLTRPPDTYHHLQVTVGQNGGRGIVNHASILDHPSVHARMFPEALSPNSACSPLVRNTHRKVPVVASKDFQPLDLSTAGCPNATVPQQKPTASYVPPIGVFYLKPRSRKRLDDVVKRLWARHGTNSQVPAVLSQISSV